MKVSVLASLCIQASLSHAFEIPFKLPFGITLPFGKPSSAELLALHKELVNIPSVTGSEYNVGVYIAEYLQERNYTVERIPSSIGS
jgi:hypothetical protein